MPIIFFSPLFLIKLIKITQSRVKFETGPFLFFMMETAAALGLIMGGGGGGGEVKHDAAELELGLSLGSGGGGVGKMKRSSECGSSSNCGGGRARILTAKDFPNGFPSVRAAAAAVSGTKRAADDPYVGSPPTASSQVVGWPPIGAYRMNSLANANSQSKLSNEEQEDDGVVEEITENSKKKMSHGFVKVNMDGHPIGRKVDLIAHTSYKTLAQTLEDMFFKPTPKAIDSLCSRGKQQKMVPFKLLDKSSEFVLTYEDKDGDWMLVGDVPWGMFLSTVKRLRIMRTSSESNGLGMDSHI